MFQPFNDYGYLRHDVRCGIDCGQRQVLKENSLIGSRDGPQGS